MELARNAAGVLNAQHGEVHPDAADQVAAPLSCALKGQVRRVMPVPGTRFAAIAGTAPFDGMHYCSYGANPRYLPLLRAAGLVEAAHAQDAGLEAFELAGHPFFLGTLFQPQIGASSGVLHPLIGAFVQASLESSGSPQ